MSQQIAIRIPTHDLVALDDAVARGRFPNRAAAVREALARLLRDERRRSIEEADRRGYGADPQEEWIGAAGLAAFASLVAAEERDEDPL
ncbi:MAG: ribbon-helix-helix domain-containing protein [Gaiella sp.]|nr:ribbon-helix-helix domain-containing protein [Gaiella sp.]